MINVRYFNISLWVLALFIWSCCLVSCTINSINDEVSKVEPIITNSEINENTTLADEMTIAMPLSHEIRIFRKKDEQKQAQLSPANVKELESWWDSLPEPVQSQIKAQEIDIEVVSKIRTHNKKVINPQLNDSQIENTGEALEQIIGSETGMTYTVNTTLIENKENALEEEHETNIRLVKQMPVKLQQFDTEIFLREQQVNNDNIQSLQYWWTHLPEGIQEKVKSREIIVDVNYHQVASVEGVSSTELRKGEEFTIVMTDVLQRLVGIYKIGNKEFSLARVASTCKAEKPTTHNANLPSKHYIKVSLRKNKEFVPAPL